MKRYSPIPLWSRHYEVECPHCKHQAMVMGDKFVCDNCFHKEFREDKKRYIARAKLSCPCCFEQIESELNALGRPLKTMIVHCNNCNTDTITRATNIPYYIYPKSQGCKTDPLFGYPLWYYSTVKGKAFWSYNRIHLNEIENFVEADIRRESKIVILNHLLLGFRNL